LRDTPHAHRIIRKSQRKYKYHHAPTT